MKAKKVYEFIQKKGIKTEIGSSVLEKKSIEEWFAKHAPNADYTINPDLSIDVEGNLYIFDATEEPDNLTVNGDKHWFLNNKRHREDGPAVEFSDGSKHWYQNDNFHREDGPAAEYGPGNKSWYINGLLHREDGPATEYSSGLKGWWLNGKEYYSEKDYYKKLKTL